MEHTEVEHPGLITFSAVVTDMLPGGKCRVALANGHHVLADNAGIEPLRVGETIFVEISPRDTSAVRSVFRRTIRNEMRSNRV